MRARFLLPLIVLAVGCTIQTTGPTGPTQVVYMPQVYAQPQTVVAAQFQGYPVQYEWVDCGLDANMVCDCYPDEGQQITINQTIYIYVQIDVNRPDRDRYRQTWDEWQRRQEERWDREGRRQDWERRRQERAERARLERERRERERLEQERYERER